MRPSTSATSWSARWPTPSRTPRTPPASPATARRPITAPVVPAAADHLQQRRRLPCRRGRRGDRPRHVRRDRLHRHREPDGRLAAVRYLRGKPGVLLLAARLGDRVPAAHHRRWRHQQGRCDRQDHLPVSRLPGRDHAGDADGHDRSVRRRHDPVRRHRPCGQLRQPPRHGRRAFDRIQVRRGSDRDQGDRALRHQHPRHRQRPRLPVPSWR
jgi:hypothetical protein